ncbi:sodium:solute symporter [Hydrocarboniclastica marina]|uniref:Sodium:solute symporter n=1 Tax=Hydrocarboniclastica marina TaxID=2259620 RepID=A0A4P7XGC4_9ALTE|nr:sodium:solute symporter [Hydrocarboniclastica marina]MAL99306.1 sodium:solute symporter [Alteromonadaceae bacterium]QCF26048.1 sodium:solute symporter [Hydrocarboniclastica marina]|tara:strand:+ start:7519 stop:8916 length:1398 start_codon:yes stop_codon:yes gene_type:complete
MIYTTGASLALALLLFAWVGVRARRVDGGLDDYMTARNSQGARTLGLSFLASGMGSWILFAPPEVAALAGPVALAGYAVGAALPFLILAYCGPAIRRRVPHGQSIGDFAQACFGTLMRRWVAFLSVLYMLCFLAAELTAIGAITTLLSELDGRWVVIAVALTTLTYTAWGGLRASLVTDRWQAPLLLALLGVVAFVALQYPSDSPAEHAMPQLPLASGLGVALTLIIAVTAANLFHQGYWQRLWAAQSAKKLGQGALLGGAATVLVVALVGGLGVAAVVAGVELGTPPMPFFALLTSAPDWLALPALVLALTLVASSVDTLQNAIASLALTERRGLTLTNARWLTVALMLPVVLIALQGMSVLRLFLIADLLCASAVVPVLLGLWARMTTSAALAGSIAGLVATVIPGWYSGGSLISGLELASFPGGVPTLAPFAWALGASTATSLGVAFLMSSPAMPADGQRET